VVRYDILEKIAEGGMGEVFLAEAAGEHGFRKRVAVKRLRPQLAQDAELALRVITEAKLAVSLTHANIVQVLDLARSGSELFIVMEYVDGADLSHLLKRAHQNGAPVPLGILLHVAIEALKGLDYAHQRPGADTPPVVHCDISPSNLLLSYAGEVKITDFGVAQILAHRQTHIAGKAPYMSPEQMAGERLDARADLYSIATVIWDALGSPQSAGEPPGDRRPTNPTPDCPAALLALLTAARALDREKRPASAHQMLVAISEIARDCAPVVTAREVGEWVSRLSPPATRSRRPDLGDALRDLLGRPPTGTQERGSPPRSFVVKSSSAREVTVWEPLGSRHGRRRSLTAFAALAALSLLCGVAVVATRHTEVRVVETPPPLPDARTADLAPPTPVKAAPAPADTASAPPRAPLAAAPAPAVIRRRPSGFLNVFADPWARVFIDDRPVGVTPVRRAPLTPGPHRVRLEHPTSKSIERVITVRSGATELLDVEMRP
jgi:serine/threonine protein kinase